MNKDDDFLFYDIGKQKHLFNKILREINPNPKASQYETAVSMICIFDSLILAMKEELRKQGLLPAFILNAGEEIENLIKVHIIWCDLIDRYMAPTFGIADIDEARKR